MEESLVRKKAELILGGDVRIPEGFRAPFRISKSTAGPGAGKRGVVFAFGGTRVKKGIVDSGGDFELIVKEEGYSLNRNGETFIDNVTIEPVIFHAPGQAFFNMDNRCIFRCIYCKSPNLEKGSRVSGEKMASMIRGLPEGTGIGGIAITSGVAGGIEETVRGMIECVSVLHKEFPNLPIGVEPYVNEKSQIEAFRNAGVSEMKINVETARKDIFDLACPGLDQDTLLEMLDHSVSVFGRGKVASNIIIGLGETDGDVEAMMERLCDMGVVPGLRPLKAGPEELLRISGILGAPAGTDAERVVSLAKTQKRILEEHGLDVSGFRTMCFACGCCDLVPFRDL
jgi:biotin synthase-related radical SAM superfamily protein